MKIIITMQIPYVPALGGANKCNRTVAESLVRKGHVVQVIVPAINAASPFTYHQFRNQLQEQGIDVHSNDGVDVFHLDGVEIHAAQEPSQVRLHLLDQIRTFEPDWVLVSCEEWSQGLLEAAVKTIPLRVMYLVHTVLFLPFGPQAFFPSPQRAKLIEKTAGIVACSHFVKEYIQKWSGLQSTVFHFPAYGAGPFSPVDCFDQGFVTLVNPSAGKGISVFLELAKKFPEVQFAAVPTWGTTHEDCVALESFPNITLLEPTEEFDRILAQTRVLVIPSLWPEGFGLTTIEAMLRGIPVLASNAGGLPEAKLGTGFVLPVEPITGFTEDLDDRLIPIPIVPEQKKEHLDQWYDALQYLLADRASYEKHSSEARERALEFISHLSVDPLEDLLTRLASQHQSSQKQPQSTITYPAFSHGSNQSRDLTEKLADLTPEKKALLLKWLRAEGKNKPEEGSQCSKILPVDRNKPLPLSFAQQRLWFLDQLEPGSTAYSIPLAVRLRGPLNFQALEQSLNQLVQRHESLRTTFTQVDGETVQVIEKSLTFSVPLFDLQSYLEPEREAEMHRLVTKEAQTPFDLAVGPLFRAQVLRLATEDHIFLMTLHHIISDGWSMVIFYRECALLYEAHCAGHDLSLPPLSIQYADYGVWQRKWLQGEVLEQQLAYWREQLTDLTTLDFPLDHPRPLTLTHCGQRHTFTLSTILLKGLKAVGQQAGTTLFMTVLAAFQVLLARYTGQVDIAVGSPIANRNRPETEGLIGFFVNSLVMRTDLSGDPVFLEALRRVHQVALGAYEHQDLPIEQLVEELHPVRDLSRNPIFQVMFAVQHASSEGFTLPGVTVCPFRTETHKTKFDLDWQVREQDEHLEVVASYNTDLFEAGTIERMGRHFQTVLEEVVRDPGQRLSHIPLLQEAERRQLLVEWNATQQDYPKEACIHELFEEQVARNPEAVAVVFDGHQLSYHELNSRANHLAHYLKKRGVGPEVRVGICMERSLDLVISLLGILKAGGAYVPLDPGNPSERLLFILTDSQASLLVTQDQFRDRFPGYKGGVINLNTAWTEISSELDINLSSRPNPDNLAYIIYTSGSTGHPKGVQVSHANVVRLFLETEAWYHFTAKDVWTLFHSYAFDFSVWEIWGAFLYGGRAVIVPYDISRSPDEFYKLLVREQVTILNQTPPAFRQLIQAEATVGVNPNLALRYVIFGGEALELQSLNPWFNRHGDKTPQLVNMYGITETTVHVTYHPLSADQAPLGSVIGRAIPDLQVYILDGHLAPVPIGVSGELYVGGSGVARGYQNRSDLTAERFIPHPFSELPGARLYKTGDRARYCPSGVVEYLGRIDHQVQLRGFRIELGEIEVLLRQHPEVQDTVVLCREDEPGEKRLVGYVVSSQETIATSDLLSALKQTLPAYMLPAAFVVLESFPLTHNGKVDRARLPKPEWASPQSRDSYVAPGTQKEKLLVEIWEEVLKLDQVGIHDNFFELGGHSLLATQVVSRIREKLSVDLKLRYFFETPSIAGLAQGLEALSWNLEGRQVEGKAETASQEKGII